MSEPLLSTPQGSAIPSSYRYPRRYAIRQFDSQAAELRNFFPRLDPDPAWRLLKRMHEYPAPPRSEGIFLFINSTFFGRREVGVREVVAALREQRRGRFRSYLDGKFDSAHLRLRTTAMRGLQRVLVSQLGDIWIAYAQFGKCHQGKVYERHLDSVRGEFNLDLLSVSSMILTHPNRFVHDTDLHANCGGDQVAMRPRAGFTNTPFFQYQRGKLRLDVFDTEVPFPHDGAVTAFVP
jgi:hypothetical protein